MAKKTTNTSKEPRLEWLFGGNPNAIYNQESEGQKELNNSDQLPRKCNSPKGINIVEQYKLMGIEVLNESDGDELFLDVKMPDGWRKDATGHSMWNNLVDDKGRIRGVFFYKAAFYDRDSFMNFTTRYEWKCDYSEKEFVGYQVWDSEKQEVVFNAGKLVKNYDAPDYFQKQDELRDVCEEFLKNNFPNHEDINAYWS